MVEVSAVFAIIAFVVLVATATFYGILTDAGEPMIDATQAEFADEREQIDTRFLVSSATHTDGQLQLDLNNTGDVTLSVNATDVIIDGLHHSTASFDTWSVDGTTETELWHPGETLHIELTVEIPNRLKVVTEHGITEFTTSIVIVKDRIVFVDTNGNLKTVDTSGDIIQYDTTEPAGIGPMIHSVDGEIRHEIPFESSVNDSRIVDTNNVTATLDDSGALDGKHQGVGDWDDDGTIEVVYVRNGQLYEVEFGGSPTNLGTRFGLGTINVVSVAGVSDFDEDGDTDIVYVSNSNTIDFVDSSGNTGTAGVTISEGNAVGRPADYDNDESPEIPHYDNLDNGINLVDASGTEQSVTPSYQVEAAPMGGIDWNGDDTPDVVHLASNQSLLYLDFTASDSGLVTDTSGNEIVAKERTGAA